MGTYEILDILGGGNTQDIRPNNPQQSNQNMLLGMSYNQQVMGGMPNQQVMGGMPNQQVLGGMPNQQVLGGMPNQQVMGGMNNLGYSMNPMQNQMAGMNPMQNQMTGMNPMQNQMAGMNQMGNVNNMRGMNPMQSNAQQNPYIPNKAEPQTKVNPLQLAQGEKITFTGQDKIDLLNNQEGPIVPVDNKTDHTKSDAFADLESRVTDQISKLELQDKVTDQINKDLFL